MASEANKSGFEVGCEYAEKLRAYLSSVEALPARGGVANKAAVAQAAGIPRESLYTNPACSALLDEAIQTKGLAGAKKDDERAKLERRLSTLEQTNAALVAEVHELRRKLEQYRHIEAMLEEGRRVIP